jgi:hypothetical protein
MPVFAGGNPIKPGIDIEDVSKLMKNAGYKETALDMLSTKTDTELKMWAVGEGVLILVFSTKDRKVTNISYYLSDERPKAERKTFSLSVLEFDPTTREMRIKLPNKPGFPGQ